MAENAKCPKNEEIKILLAYISADVVCFKFGM